MKKHFGSYVAVWAALLVLFNIIAFTSANWDAMGEHISSFWIAYIFIMLTFVGHFLCSMRVYKEDTAQKRFYNLSVVWISYIGLIVSFVVGGLCMVIPSVPSWVTVILCAGILAANVMSVVKAREAVIEIERLDKKVQVQTFFIKSLTVDADTLMAQAKSDAIRAECRKVYEAVRYSDPMSSDALSSVETQITIKFAELSDAVQADDAIKTVACAREVLILVGDRNKKCKLLK
ncbi:MAG: hypothetical protein IJY28_08810 [Clostridia bacterium]|nr:hypothetical protein [Clostridia bacterium]